MSSLLNFQKPKQRIKAIGYVRQSDEREDKEDISEQTQLTKIQQFCDFNDWELVAVFRDIDYSGFRISYTKRPGLMDSMKYLTENSDVRKFVSFNLSRLTRRKKDFTLIQESLNHLNVDICSTAENLDFGSPTGRLVANILVNFNEYYSDNLSDVTSDNKKTNAEKGRWNGGPMPYGLIKRKEYISLNGGKGDTVIKMFQMAKEGKGPFIIKKWLNEKGIKTETGKLWSQRRVRYVLTNETYAGMQLWDGVYYPLLNAETAVSWDDFLYIQDTLFGKEKAWRGKERQLLTGILRCGCCGSKMHSRKTNSNKSDTRRYLCYLKNEPEKCPSPIFDLHSLNEVVIDTIATEWKKRYSPDVIESHIIDNQDKHKSIIQTLRREHDNIEVAKQKIFDDYYLHSKITEDQYTASMKRYESRQQEIDVALAKVPMPKSQKYGNYEDILKELGSLIKETATVEEQRTIVELLIEKIVPGHITCIHFKWGETIEIPVTVSTRSGSKKQSEVCFFKQKKTTQA